MGGLVLKLGAGERVLINGAVVENCDRRGRISILTPNSRVLRLKDALRPDEVGTPARRVYYLAQLVVCGEVDFADVDFKLARDIRQLSQMFDDEASRTALAEALEAVQAADAYTALKRLRPILQREEGILREVE